MNLDRAVSLRRLLLLATFLAAATLIAPVPSSAAGGVTAGSAGSPGTGSLGSIRIEGAYVRPSLGKAPNSAAYMTISTTGGPDRLLDVDSPAAEAVELHAHTVDGDGVMRMRAVDAVPIEPGEPARLLPGAYHVMLIGLTAPLEEGSTIQLTLSFEAAGEVTLEVPVGMSPERVDHSHSGHGTGHSR